MGGSEPADEQRAQRHRGHECADHGIIRQSVWHERRPAVLEDAYREVLSRNFVTSPDKMSQFVSGDENSSAVAAAQQAQAERVELDEARRVALVIGARIVLEGHDLLAVERIRRSEEHTSELQSLMSISYAVFCLKKKKNNKP